MRKWIEKWAYAFGFFIKEYEKNYESSMGVLIMFLSVKMSYSSWLVVLNSEIMAPWGPAWNQCFVLGGMVCWWPG